jgi:hypothetical protein
LTESLEPCTIEPVANQRVLIDPDGTAAPYLLLLVPATTGITYQHQAAGFACEQRELDGYLVPLGPPDRGRELTDAFVSWFRGWPPPLGHNKWDETTIAALDTAVTHIFVTVEDDEGRPVDRAPLKVDWERRDELTEGWIPVLSTRGRSILVFPNSD